MSLRQAVGGGLREEPAQSPEAGVIAVLSGSWSRGRVEMGSRSHREVLSWISTKRCRKLTVERFL